MVKYRKQPVAIDLSEGGMSKGKKRYLPEAAWKALSPVERAATNRAKAAGNEQGKQSYQKAADILNQAAPQGKTLDFGAGLGNGLKSQKSNLARLV